MNVVENCEEPTASLLRVMNLFIHKLDERFDGHFLQIEADYIIPSCSDAGTPFNAVYRNGELNCDATVLKGHVKCLGG